MRILFVTSQFPMGRGEAFLLPEIESLANLGHELLVTPVHPSIPLRRVYESGRYAARAEPLVSMRVALGAVHELTVGVGLPKAAFVARAGVAIRNAAALPKALWATQVARAWGAEHVHAYWGSVPATVAWIASVRTGIPWSLTLHRWDIYANNQLQAKLNHACFARVISARSAAMVRSVAPHAPPPRILRLGVTVDPDRDSGGLSGARLNTLPGSTAELRVLVPASLVPVKGHAILIRAVARARSRITVDVVGDGPLRSRLRDLVADLGLSDRIRFLGWREHSQLLCDLASGDYDAVVLPSTEQGTEHEGIPVALMEAMAAGLPVISTVTGSIPELVTPDVGILIDQDDVPALSDALDLLAASPELAHRLGSAGRRRVRAEFSADASARSLAGWFREAAPGSRLGGD